MKNIKLTSIPGKYDVDFGVGFYSLVTRFNHQASCWTMDIIDSIGITIISGLMLVPLVDLLYPYPTVGEVIGALMVVEKNTGDHLIADMLGVNVQLLWYSPEDLENL